MCVVKYTCNKQKLNLNYPYPYYNPIKQSIKLDAFITNRPKMVQLNLKSKWKSYRNSAQHGTCSI